ncbi:MAG: hypothetical protein ACR2KO_06835, partial [Geodermatophilaceae bacterium]
MRRVGNELKDALGTGRNLPTGGDNARSVLETGHASIEALAENAADHARRQPFPACAVNLRSSAPRVRTQTIRNEFYGGAMA